MKTIRVVAALMVEDNKVLIAARKKGTLQGLWEFPGGKIEEGESPEQALIREIKEEMEIAISVDKYLMTREYDYPEFHLSMDCFWCEILSGNLVLKEAEDARWLAADELDSVEWLPADVTLIEKIKMDMGRHIV